MTMGECAVRDQRNPIIDGVCAGCGARVREPLSVLTMPDDSCPLCSAGASIRRALLAVRGEALDWSTRLFSIECSERWARGASERADDEGRDDLAAKLRGCESGLAHGGDAIRALIQTRARLAEVEAERDAARAGVEELRLTLAAERELVARVFRTIHMGRRHLPLWAHVADVFAHGSTLSRELCRRMGYDPEQEVGGRKRAAMLAADKATT